MAGRPNQINIEDFHINLINLEKKVIQFGGLHDGKIPEIANDLSEVRKYVGEQKASADTEKRAELISGLGNVVVTSINSLDDLTSNEPKRVLQGSLNIAITIASVVGGPYGAAAGALCSVLGALVSAGSPKEPDLATKFAGLVRIELQKFHRKLEDEKFAGLQHRVMLMNNSLQHLSKESSESDIDNLIDHVLYETDLPSFIGKVAYNITNELTKDSSEEDTDDCVRSMVIYCNAQTTLFILLANIMARLKTTGKKTTALQSLFDGEKKSARDLLKFLSDKVNLGPASHLPTEGGKIYKIMALRRNIPAYEVVESFRASLGLSTMADIDELRKIAYDADLFEVRSVIGSYPSPHEKGDNHYFQFINHTDLPVKIDCGKGGGRVNGLKFCTDIKKRSSYEHIATKKTWNFSTCGYFIIYLDGLMRDHSNRFNGSIKVYEFSLSNPVIGARKANILDKSKNVSSSIDGSECWNSMTCANFDKPIYFLHAKKHYMLQASLGGGSGLFNALNLPVIKEAGKNGCFTWRFVLQDFDPLEDMQMSYTKWFLKLEKFLILELPVSMVRRYINWVFYG